MISKANLSPSISFLDSFQSSPAAATRPQTSEITTPSLFESCYQKCADSINWVIENRGGLAKIIGLIMVPAQHMADTHAESNRIINRLVNDGLDNGNIEKISIPMGDKTIEGIICYPKNWNKEDKSQCILYHNPNAVATAGFIHGNKLSSTPGELFEKRNCPIIMYDYRGVGLNQDVTTPNPNYKFHATYESVVVDGQAALEYALSKFGKVEVMGSSLGGGVATASLDRHLTKNPLDLRRVELINHDSFTTTPRVMFPNLGRVADCAGHVIGANLDAMTPMKNLIERGVKVKVLCHTKDPVIPFGARMGDFVLSLPKSDNVTVFNSPRWGHANLSPEMLAAL